MGWMEGRERKREREEICIVFRFKDRREMEGLELEGLYCGWDWEMATFLLEFFQTHGYVQDVERKSCTGQGKHSGILIGQLIKDRMHVCQVFFALVSETYMYVIL